MLLGALTVIWLEGALCHDELLFSPVERVDTSGCSGPGHSGVEEQGTESC